MPGPVYVLNVKRRWMIDCFRIDGLFDWWFPPGIDGWVMGRIDLGLCGLSRVREWMVTIDGCGRGSKFSSNM